MSFRSEKHKKRLALVLGLILASLLVFPVNASTQQEGGESPPSEETNPLIELTEDPGQAEDAEPVLLPDTPLSAGLSAMNSRSKGTLADSLHLDKTASYNPLTGKVDIRLEAFSTLEPEDYPFDIVLIADHSLSMNSARLGYLKTALTAFINQVEANAQATGLTHRISLVRYCGTYNNQVRDLTSNYNQLRSDVNAMSLPWDPANDGTRIDLGLKEAHNQISTDAKSPPDNNRVVILFTAGKPEAAVTSGFNMTYANWALEEANKIKGLSKTSLHVVGVFDHANAGVMHGDSVQHAGLFDHYSTGTVNSFWDIQVASLISTNDLVVRPYNNRLMNLISSNFTGNLPETNRLGLSRETVRTAILTYFDRVTINQAYTLSQSGYFLTGGKNDGAAYLAAYLAIADRILPEPGLGHTSRILDYLAPHLLLTSGSAPPLLQVADATGYDPLTGTYSFGPATTAPSPIAASYDLNGQSLQVTGFSFLDHGVTQTPKAGTSNDYGRKLIVSFSADVETSFFGGNLVPSNLPESGVYLGNNSPVKMFEVPRVHLPIKYEMMADLHETVYLGQSVDLASLISFITSSGVHYSPNGTNNGYVRITYSLFAADDLVNPIATYVISPGQHKDAVNWSGALITPDYAHDTYVLKVLVEPSQAGTFQAVNRSAIICFDLLTGSITIVKEAKAGTVIGSRENFLILISDTLGNSWKLAVTTNSPVTLKGLSIGSYTVSEDSAWSWRYQATVNYPDGGSSVTLQPEDSMHQTVTVVNEKINRRWLTDEKSVLNRFGGQ